MGVAFLFGIVRKFWKWGEYMLIGTALYIRWLQWQALCTSYHNRNFACKKIGVFMELSRCN